MFRLSAGLAATAVALAMLAAPIHDKQRLNRARRAALPDRAQRRQREPATGSPPRAHGPRGRRRADVAAGSTDGATRTAVSRVRHPP